MQIGLMEFLSDVATNPPLLITILLTLGVILVNGWTDAPNAIATCVATRSIGPRPAIMLAAVFNFLGMVAMTLITPRVAETIYNMVDFGGDTARGSDRALCAAHGRHRGMGHGGLVVRHPHQRKPRSDRRAVRVRPSRCTAGLAASTAANGSRSCTAWCSPPFWALAFGWLAAKLIELLCGSMDRRQNHRLFPGAHRLPAARPWPLCTARRTARNSWAFSCWASFWPRDRQMSTSFTDPACG